VTKGEREEDPRKGPSGEDSIASFDRKGERRGRASGGSDKRIWSLLLSCLRRDGTQLQSNRETATWRVREIFREL
jgi:hypothetical protein